MATTKKSTGSSTGKTRTPPSTKGGTPRAPRRPMTDAMRNARARAKAHGAIRGYDTAYDRARTVHGIIGHAAKANISYNLQEKTQEVRTQHQAIRLENTTQAQIRRRQIQRQEGRRQAVVDTFTKAPSLPKPGGTAGSYIMILGVGGLVLIVAYVAFTHGPGTTNVLSTFTQFMTNLASEQPLFKETTTSSSTPPSNPGGGAPNGYIDPFLPNQTQLNQQLEESTYQGAGQLLASGDSLSKVNSILTGRGYAPLSSTEAASLTSAYKQYANGNSSAFSAWLNKYLGI